MTIKELRCSKCNKMLAKVKNFKEAKKEETTRGIEKTSLATEIKCPRCKTNTVFEYGYNGLL